MGRRCRHLHGRSAGTWLYLDARRLSGISNGGAVSAWNNLSGAGPNYTQGTAGNRPVFLVNQQGGNPGIDFNRASAHFLSSSANASIANWAVSCLFTLDSTNVNPSSEPFGVSGILISTADGSWALRTNINDKVVASGATASVTTTSASVAKGSATLVSGVTSGTTTHQFFVNGVADTSASMTRNSSSASSAIGRDGVQARYFDGRIFSIWMFAQNNTTNAFRRRIEHSMALSFKVPCA